jgi:hypothetical protein
MLDQYVEDLEEVKSIVGEKTLSEYIRRTSSGADEKAKLGQLMAACVNTVPRHRVVERAVTVIRDCLKIRNVLAIEEILDDHYFPENLVRELEMHSFMSVVGSDNKGSTIISVDLTSFSPAGFANCWRMGMREIPEGFRGHSDFDDPNVVNYCSLWYVRMMEWIHRHRFEAYKAGETGEPRVVMVVNIDGAGLSTFSPELRAFLKGIKGLGEYLFPEICDYIVACNVPWIADKLWPVVRLVLPAATASKVCMYDRNRTKTVLKDLIKLDELPPALGGQYQPERRFKHRIEHVEGKNDEEFRQI